jgi:short-chain fatty acids transporter
MLKGLSKFFAGLAERWMPDPMVVAVLLTVVCMALAVALTDFGPMQAVDAWGEGFWKLLAFTMQMVLILGLGHVAAHTRPVYKLLETLARQVKTPATAYGGLAFLAGIIGLFSWGLALIVPAVMTRILAGSCKERGIKIHFPLLVASGWAGASTSMQGLSASIPLTINTPGHFLEAEIGLIPLSATILTVWSLCIVGAKLICVPTLMAHLGPADSDIREMPPLPHAPDAVPEPSVIAGVTPSQKIENSRFITIVLAVLGCLYLIRHFVLGGSLNLNTLNMCLLVLSLALSDSPRHFLGLLANAGRVVSPFLIQYPMYAGIMGIIAASGLGALLVNGFVAIATPESLPIWTFLSAGFLNLFIPSAGGQWAVQGPIAVDAALQLGTDIPRLAMSLTLGESWSNAVQPLYAIPVLAVAGLHVRDIIGYGVMLLGLNGTIYLTALLLF